MKTRLKQPAKRTQTGRAHAIESKWPAHIYTIRHGQSAGNVARDDAEARGLSHIGLADRDMDVELSPLGRAQAEALGDWLATRPLKSRPTRILSSPYVRARQTAESIKAHLQRAGHEPSFAIDERLREREFGLISGYTRLGIEQKFPAEAESYTHLKKFYYRPPGGESWCDVILRLRSVVETLSRDFPHENVVIVCHTVVVNCFRYLFEELTEDQILELDREFEIANCSITSYVPSRNPQTARPMELQMFNFVDHLREAGKRVTKSPDVPNEKN